MASIPGDLPGDGEPADARDELQSISGGGMSWCWELDFAALVDAVTGAAPWLRGGDRDGSAGGATAKAAGAKADAVGAKADAAAAATDPGSVVAGDLEAEQAAYLEAVD